MVLLNAHFEYKTSNGASLNFDCVNQRFDVGSRPAKCRCHYNASHVFLFLRVLSVASSGCVALSLQDILADIEHAHDNNRDAKHFQEFLAGDDYDAAEDRGVRKYVAECIMGHGAK
jgi:hypothetical protein